jgi:hypothetical protein
MPNFKREWMEKARVDYFSPFVNLWLSCNSWYQNHYAGIPDTSDRGFINIIKSDRTGRNLIYNKFNSLMSGSDKESINFKNNLEMLHFGLENASIIPDKIKFCSLRNILEDYNRKDDLSAYINMVISNYRSKIKANGDVRSQFETDIFRLDSIYIKNDFSMLFAGLFEIIYTVRNLTIHGRLEPNEQNHEVVKYCYNILWDLIKEL